MIRRVREAMPDIQAQLPAGMKAGIPYDSTEYIEDAINEVLTTLTETLLIVIVVIFLFLGSFRAVIIPIVAIPISLIGAVFLMLAAGFTINLLTLLAIVLSVGLVVDDAIVMVENIERHMHAGKPPLQAAIDAARELVGPIIAMTITLAAVYAPVGIQGGLTGALFREFAFTLAGAVIVSGVVALTLSPMMGVEAPARGRHRARLRRLDQPAVRRRCAASTRRMLAGTLRYRPVVLVLWAIVAAADRAVLHVLAAGARAGGGPGRRLLASSRPPRTRRIDQTTLFTQQVHDVYRALPEADSIFQLTFPTGGFGGMVTKPWSERTQDHAGAPDAKSSGPLSQIPGIRVDPADAAAAAGRRRLSGRPRDCLGGRARAAGEFAEQLVGKAFASGMFMFADTDLKFDQPQAEVVFDRDKLRSQGVDLSQAGRDLSTLLGGDYVNRFSIQGRSYKVIPQVKRAERLTPDQLGRHLRHRIRTSSSCRSRRSPR